MKLLYSIILLVSVCSAQTINSFMIFGDSHYISPSESFKESILFELIDAAIEEEVDFIFIVGDLILRDGAENIDYDSLLADWKFIQDTLNTHGIRLYACRGNNDTYSTESWKYLFSEEYALPGNGPEEEKPYTYSFSYDNFLFLSLDQYIEYHKVNQNWIDDQLQANDKPFVFVASHEPAFKLYWNGLGSYPEERDTFWKSLSKNRGKIYFSGHSHFYDHCELIDEDDFSGNNVHQIIVGTGGGGFHSDSTYDGNNGVYDPQRIFHDKTFGYLIVKVSESNISTSWKHRIAPFKFEDGGDNYDFMLSSIIKENEIPTEYLLSQNYPNPFNPITTIKYSIHSYVIASETKQSNEITSAISFPGNDNVNVTLKVHDILGREVATLVNQQQKPGNYEIEFDGSELTSGIYFYRLQCENYIETKKMILLK